MLGKRRAREIEKIYQKRLIEIELQRSQIYKEFEDNKEDERLRLYERLVQYRVD